MTRRKKGRVAKTPAGPRDPGPKSREPAQIRVRQLYEISKLLAYFESVEGTLTAILERVGETVPLRSVIFILQGVGHTRSTVWGGRAETAELLNAAKVRARESYAYLGRSGVDLDENEPRPLAGARGAAGDKSGFLLLPLVVDHRPIFGALQFEIAGVPGEDDLVFVNAVANQLAVALDRRVTIEAKQANAEAGRVAAELREARTEAERSWLKTVLDRMPGGVLIAEGASGKLLLANRQAEQIWGGPLAGSDIAGHRKGFHPEDGRPYQPEEWPLARSIATGEIVTEEEIDYVRSDGTGGTLLVSSTPIEEPGRGIVSGVAIHHDITERKRAAKAQSFLVEASAVLASSLDYRTALADVVRMAVPLVGDACFLDEVGKDGELHRIEVALADPKQQALADRIRNQAALPGSATPQAKVLESGKSVLLAELGSSDLEGISESAEIFRAAGLRSMIVVPLLARGQKLGTLTFAGATTREVYAPSDLAFAEEVALRVALAMDSARLYQDAQNAIRARDGLIAVVSHDLRTPLATISGTVELLARSEATDEKRPKWIDALKRSAVWMKRLIDDLLDVGRIEAGGLSIQPERWPIRSILGEALDLLRPLAQQKALHLEVQLPEREYDVICDRPRILQVLANLIGNAIKFTPEGGAITVRAEPGEREVRFSVADSGLGIAADDLPHIFERFWQARKTARAGAGLGLAIARGIVDAHNGKIWAKSERGKGATFYFTLPIAASS
ncbi:MAG: GAF domain-containing protein [Actinobacteria bacterium]|nr:GAF domain-containing protein [Actinomycetota bacterium]